jgi:hypothetical protein
LASWAKAGAGTKAKTALMTALMRAAKRLALAAPAWPVVLTKTLYRIGLSAVVDDRAAVGGAIVTAEGPARKPSALISLLILPQLAYLDGGWPRQSSPTTNFRQDDDVAASPTRRIGRSICELLL